MGTRQKNMQPLEPGNSPLPGPQVVQTERVAKRKPKKESVTGLKEIR